MGTKKTHRNVSNTRVKDYSCPMILLSDGKRLILVMGNEDKAFVAHDHSIQSFSINMFDERIEESIIGDSFRKFIPSYPSLYKINLDIMGDGLLEYQEGGLDELIASFESAHLKEIQELLDIVMEKLRDRKRVER